MPAEAQTSPSVTLGLNEAATGVAGAGLGALTPGLRPRPPKFMFLNDREVIRREGKDKEKGGILLLKMRAP